MRCVDGIDMEEDKEWVVVEKVKGYNFFFQYLFVAVRRVI